MNLLFTLYTTLHLVNPFVPIHPHIIKPVLQSSQPLILVPAVTREAQLSGGNSRGEDALIAQQPDPAIIPPGAPAGFDPTTQAGSFPVNGDTSCQSYTSCMNELYGATPVYQPNPGDTK